MGGGEIAVNLEDCEIMLAINHYFRGHWKRAGLGHDHYRIADGELFSVRIDLELIF